MALYAFELADINCLLHLKEMEPFDEVLNHQVYALEEERMAWEKTIGDRRRVVPGGVREMMESLITHERGTEYQHDVPLSSIDDLDVDLRREHSVSLAGSRFSFLDVLAALPNLPEISATHARAITQNRRVLEVCCHGRCHAKLGFKSCFFLVLLHLGRTYHLRAN